MKSVCAVYARVSTDMQGESLDNQVDYAQEYIRRLGDDFRFDAAFVYTDYDHSGYYTRFVQRPAIQRALEDARARKYDVIVFKEISRISRDQAEHVEIVSRFTQYGVRVIAINDNLDSARPETLDLLGIHSVMAEMESKRISSRVSSGKKSLARRGYWSGEAPIGYKLNTSTRQLEIDEAYCDIPQTIFRLFAKDRYGTLKIADYLNRHCLYTKKGGLWSRVTVSRVLRNPAYTGDLVYGRTRNTLKRIFDDHGYEKRQGRSRVPEEDWVIVRNTHPALVDRTTFDSVQIMLSSRTRKIPGRSRHPLSGILKCGRCGSGMVCHKRTHGLAEYRYYSCSRAFRFGRCWCTQPNVNAHEIEHALWNYLLRQFAVFQGVRVAVTHSSLTDLNARVRKLERELRKAQMGLERLLMDTEIPRDTFTKLKSAYVLSIANIEADLSQLSVQLINRKDTDAEIIEVREYLAQFTDFDLVDHAEKRRLFRSLMSGVIVDGYSVTEVQLAYNPHFTQFENTHIDGAV